MRCLACQKGTLSRTIKEQVFSYKGKSITLEQPGMWCDHCEEGILSGRDIEVTEKAFEEFKAKVDNLLSPADIRRIRNILQLTQREAAEIFGGGKNAFSRYETGDLKPSVALSNLLKMFERHPEDLKYFSRKAS